MQAYVGQIALFGFPFAPTGWAFCQGQLMAISQNTALYSLLGTNYGGDGRTTFGLPDFRGITQYGADNNTIGVGQLSGSEDVTLVQAQIPNHNHNLMVSTVPGTVSTAAGGILAETGVASRTGGFDGAKVYSTASTNTTLNQSSIVPAGGNLPHNNMQPYLALNYCICLRGVFPPRN